MWRNNSQNQRKLCRRARVQISFCRCETWNEHQSELGTIPLNIAFHSPTRKARWYGTSFFSPLSLDSRRKIRYTTSCVRGHFNETEAATKRWNVRSARSQVRRSQKTWKWSGASPARSRRLWKSSEHSGNFPRIFGMLWL